MTPDHAFGLLTSHPALRMLAWAWARVTGRHSSLNVALLADSSIDEAARSATTPSRRRNELVRPTAPGALLAPTQLKAHRDALTGLSTRAWFEASADELARPLAAAGHEACVLCIEVTGIDALVERYGPAIADTLRKQIATRLRRIARRSDTVLHLNGDRYLLLMSAPRDEAAVLARALAARALTDMRRPLSYRTLSNLHVDCCVGASVGPIADGMALAAHAAMAAEALQAALAVGPGQFRQHAPEISDEPVAA